MIYSYSPNFLTYCICLSIIYVRVCIHMLARLDGLVSPVNKGMKDVFKVGWVRSKKVHIPKYMLEQNRI